MSFHFFFLLLVVVVSCREDLPHDAEMKIGIKYRPEKCDNKVKIGDIVKMHFKAHLYASGKEFYNTYNFRPLEIEIGNKKAIKGWEKGIPGMCKGEIRRLTIPSDLAYGETGAGTMIPPNATVVYDLELIDIIPPKK